MSFLKICRPFPPSLFPKSGARKTEGVDTEREREDIGFHK